MTPSSVRKESQPLFTVLPQSEFVILNVSLRSVKESEILIRSETQNLGICIIVAFALVLVVSIIIVCKDSLQNSFTDYFKFFIFIEYK